MECVCGPAYVCAQPATRMFIAYDTCVCDQHVSASLRSNGNVAFLLNAMLFLFHFQLLHVRNVELAPSTKGPGLGFWGKPYIQTLNPKPQAVSDEYETTMQQGFGCYAGAGWLNFLKGYLTANRYRDTKMQLTMYFKSIH